jgi:hypothetical protein
VDAKQSTLGALSIHHNSKGRRNVKRKHLWAGFLLSMAALAVAGFAPAQSDRGERLITVLNPAIASKTAERMPLTARLDSLEGKTIYMVDIQWGGPEAAYSVFEEMQSWFAKNMPSVKTVIRRTTDNMFADDPGLRKELIANKAAAAIVGIAG